MEIQCLAQDALETPETVNTSKRAVKSLEQVVTPAIELKILDDASENVNV